MSGLARRFIGLLRRRPATFRASAEAGPAVPPPAPAAVGSPIVQLQEPRTPQSIEAALAFAASIRHLPLFSGTATQLVRSAGDENVSSRELSRLIATDPALVVHLLRIVNSPFFGVASRVATVADTLSVMGMAAVRRIVTASLLQRPLVTYMPDSRAAHAFWRHELSCAALAMHFARRRGLDGDTAYMAGLMHDVGRLAMLIQFPQNADVLLSASGAHDATALARETTCFGFDHAQAGSALLDLWGLPSAIVAAVQAHEDASEPADPLATAVWRANRAAHAMSEQADDDDSQAPWMTRIGLDVAQRRRILDEIRALEN